MNLSRTLNLLLVSLLLFYGSRGGAAMFSDSTGDATLNSAGGTADLVSMEVTENASDVLFVLRVNGNITTTDWANFMVGIATSKSPGSATNNAWGRPIRMNVVTNGVTNGMTHWIGSWVNGGGGAQLWTYGTNWAGPATMTAFSVNPGSQSTISYTVSKTSLGVTTGDTLFFDAYSSGSGGGDGALDALANPSTSISAWNQAYTSSNTNNLVKSYTLTYNVADSDGDSLPDAWETEKFGNLSQSGTGDPDNDSSTNAQEYANGTNPSAADSDGDGLSDGAETNTGIFVSLTNTGSNPLVADTDADGMKDGLESGVGRYQVVLGSFTWESARRHAQSRGGDLAVITSEAEKNDIAAEVTSAELTELWLGGYQTNGVWAWVTGEAWSYTQWIAGEPSNDPTQDYLRLKSFAEGWDNWFATPTSGTFPVSIRGYLLEKTRSTDPNKFNHSQITVAGGFQGWSPAPTNAPSNIMAPVPNDEFGWELNFKMSAATNHAGKFTTGSWSQNWGTSGTPGVAQAGGFGNDIPFVVTSTGIWRFYFNTDTLAYTFARAAAPATFAAWAAQYGLAAGSGTENADTDAMTNAEEFAANTDPTVGDTDGDGLFDDEEILGTYANIRLGSPVITNPLTRDSDNDGLPDKWEIDYYLDPTDDGTAVTYTTYINPAFGLTISSNPNGAASNPDGDALTNLQEFSGSKDPIVAEGDIVSSYAKVVVAGGFVQTKPDGSWDEVGNPDNTMQLISNFTWKLIVHLASIPPFAEFKFTTGSWSTNFGDNIPQGGAADGVGDLNGANINALPVFTAPGHYVITFNDFSKAYTIAALAVTDADSDGLPDEWEVYYGGFLSPKLSNLVPTTAYVAGSSTTAAQAFAAGTDPVRDTTAPSLVFASGVESLTWVAAGTTVILDANDVVATDNLPGNPTVTLDPLTVDTAVSGLFPVTYTATDAAGNASTLTRLIVVGDAEPGWRKLHYPKEVGISSVGSASVYGRIYLAGATPGTGQAPHITAELGVNPANTDPSTWAAGAWRAAIHNPGFTGGDDEYSASINGADLAIGTYYYAFRFKIGSGAWVYAGINAAGTDGGPWDGSNGNGTLTVTQAVVRQVSFAVDMGVQIFKGAFSHDTNGVEVRARFNNYTGGASVLNREGTSTIYSGTFAVEGAEGSTNNYKFFSTGTNATGYEAGSDRQAILTANGVPMSTGTNFFSGLSESRKITFRVDMSVQASKGSFNTNTGVVHLAGTFNSWNTTNIPLSPQGSGIYAAEVTVDGPLNAVGYKFLKGTTSADYEQVSDRTISTVLPNLQASTLPVVLFGNDDGVAPTDLALSTTAIAENNLVNAVVGTLSSTDATAGDTHTYSLVAGSGDTDNASFNIDGASLRAVAAFNFEVKASYSIRVRSTDASGNSFEKTLAITVIDVAEGGGSTFAGWSGGGVLTNPASVGKYAIGGASSLAATDGVAPVAEVTASNLVLTAIVRTDDTNLNVVGEAVASLGDFANSNAVTTVSGSTSGVSQVGVPAGHQRQAFSVDRTNSSSRQFLRLKATLAP